jgi:chemotaxis protein methyltransferase CheR
MVSRVSDGTTTHALRPDEFAWLRNFLLSTTGIDLRPGKEAMVMARLDRRMRHHGLHRYGDYLHLIADGDREEAQIAIDLLTTNETYFFREPAHFDYLRQLAARARRTAEPFTVWSAAASTGEEAYSVAMTLADSLPPGKDWSVLGTDISTRVLDVADGAVYPITATRHIPPDLLRRHCLRGRGPQEGLLAIDPQLRSRVTFRHANLMELPVGLGPFDVILLRNVMIYFNPETKRDLVTRITPLLRPGGHLIVSHAETLNGFAGRLRLVSPSIYVLPDGDGATGAAR